MNWMLISVFYIIVLSQIASAQTVSCYVEDETCPDNFPPDAEVVIAGHSMTRRDLTDPFENDADWYFYDSVTTSWSTLHHAEILPFATGVFDEEYDRLDGKHIWKMLTLQLKSGLGGNTIDVMDELTLHLINISAGYVLSMPIVNLGQAAQRQMAKHLEDWEALQIEGDTRILRCRHGFLFAYERAQLRTIEDPELIRTGALNVLNSVSPFDFEKRRFGIEHRLNPPEIWYFDSADYGPRGQIYLKLDGTYADDLEHETLGSQRLAVISLHDRLVLFDFETLEGQDLWDGIERKRDARSALLNIFPRALILTPAKWLLRVETGDDNSLTRNLSSRYKVHGILTKQLRGWYPLAESKQVHAHVQVPSEVKGCS